MKTNFTLVTKAVFVILFTFASATSFSKHTFTSGSPIVNLTANADSNSLVINWNILPNTSTNYCEVQASEDGITFTTIGFVMGADPKQTNNTFTFKQSLKKIKPGKVFYRVLNISADEKATASSVVKLPK